MPATDLVRAHRARRRMEPGYKRALARVSDPDRETITAYVRALVVELVTARRERAALEAIRAIAAATITTEKERS